jgi:hypothetical protein
MGTTRELIACQFRIRRDRHRFSAQFPQAVGQGLHSGHHHSGRSKQDHRKMRRSIIASGPWKKSAVENRSATT